MIWYQGESNTSDKESEIYGKMLSALIYYWRVAFKDENLPFTVIQLADYIHANKEAWRKIQQAQYEIQFKEKMLKLSLAAIFVKMAIFILSKNPSLQNG